MTRFSRDFLAPAAFLAGMAGSLAPAAGQGGNPGADLLAAPGAWVGEGAALDWELLSAIETGRKGPAAGALPLLADIARRAREADARHVWLEAQRWWVRFTVEDDPDADVSPAMKELLGQASEWRFPDEEASVYALWADLSERSGQWLLAVRKWDRASQISLGAGHSVRGLSALRAMARLCREAGHVWRLRQVWGRIDQVLRAWPDATGPFAAEVAAERAIDSLVAGDLTDLPVPDESVEFQPSRSQVLVSAEESEIGRTRLLLTNSSVKPVHGTLTATADHAALTEWHTGETGSLLSFGGAAPEGGPPPDSRELTLLPGQQLAVYIEHQPDTGNDNVALTWRDDTGDSAAQAGFSFRPGLPRTTVVNAGLYQLNSGWCIPVYHEVYRRSGRAGLENVHVTADTACRLEIFDQDTGRLLAVDGEGDGDFTGMDDRLLEDSDHDGAPDFTIGSRARTLEIFAWIPADHPVGEPVRVSISLRDPLNPDQWREDGENTILPPAL